MRFWNKGDWMATGYVKWFELEKGFGFIAPDDGSSDIFFHKAKFEEAGLPLPEKGTSVSYEVFKRGDKIAADKIALFTRPAPPPSAPVLPRPKKRPEQELTFEEEFEREWGLKRAF